MPEIRFPSEWEVDLGESCSLNDGNSARCLHIILVLIESGDEFYQLISYP